MKRPPHSDPRPDRDHAQEANIELHKGQQHSDPVDAEGRSYLSDLLEQIDELCAERKILLDQKKLCEDGIDAVQPLYRA